MENYDLINVRLNTNQENLIELEFESGDGSKSLVILDNNNKFTITTDSVNYAITFFLISKVLLRAEQKGFSNSKELLNIIAKLI